MHTLVGFFRLGESFVKTFNKPSIQHDEQIKKLLERGLAMYSEARTLRYLSNISYFRFSAYTRAYYIPNQEPHRFRLGTTFDDIIALYVFDRKLRLLLLDAIECLEVALRAQITNTLAEHYGPHGYLDTKVFDTRYDHAWLLAKLCKIVKEPRVEVFLQHYRSKYTDAPSYPPVWMAMELLTFKEVSILFANLRHEIDTKRIERHFGWKYQVLKSWFRSLSDMRNLCAHHMRVWNREFGSRPELPKKRPDNWLTIPPSIPTGSSIHPDQLIIPQRRLYMQLIVVESLLQMTNPGSNWSSRLIKLVQQNPHISRPHMGFPSDWEQEPFWQKSMHQVQVV